MLRNWDVAVVDLETTGVELGRSHRIVEVAAVRYGRNGRPAQEFVTLVNPERDIGNTDVHGVAAQDVRDAPTFAEVAGALLDRIAGCVLVAHNVGFDAGFLQAEFARSSVKLPPLACVCTLRLASETVKGLRSRRLADICGQVGIDLRHTHTALDDACATGHLFEYCVASLGGWGVVSLADVGCAILPTRGELWPRLPAGGRVYTREHARRAREGAGEVMATVIGRLPKGGTSEPQLLPYMAVLDKVLEDRRIAVPEARELLDLACAMGMTQEGMREAHRLYLRELMQVAIEDRVISHLEETDLQSVRRLLDLTQADYDAALEEAVGLVDSRSTEERAVGSGAESLAGKRVCFTGTFQARIAGEPMGRAVAETIAAQHGVNVCPGVTKDTDYLVVADADSMSDKAKKARAYGVPILAEARFWQILGVQVD